jgi:hypothetical protein
MTCAARSREPGARVAIGFSVRNDGPVPMTITEVESLGRGSDITLATLDPALPPAGELFVVDGPQPFEPITVAPGGEATIQLEGAIRGCDAVAGHWLPGGGIVFDRVPLTVRWLVLSTKVDLFLPHAIEVQAPAEGECA